MIIRTHCKHGHMLEERNSYITPRGHLECRACRNAASRRRNRKQGRTAIPTKDRTGCPQGHSYSPENTYIDSRGYRTCIQCRREQARKADLKRREAGPPTGGRLRGLLKPHEIMLITEGLRAGKSERQMTMPRSPDFVCHANRFIAFKKNNAKLWKPFAKIAKNNARANVAAAHARRLSAWQHRARLNPDDIMRMVSQAVPITLPRDVRDDAVSMMALAVLEGRLKPKDIAARAREFVTAHYRMFSKFAPSGGVMLSLDQPAFADAPATVGDFVTHGLWQ